AKLPWIHSPRDPPKYRKPLEVTSLDVHANGSPVTQTYLTSVELKTPWYIEMLHEKENNLIKLGEEINRLSGYEEECKRKDEIISILKGEVQQLQEVSCNKEPTQDTVGKDNQCSLGENFHSGPHQVCFSDIKQPARQLAQSDIECLDESHAIKQIFEENRENEDLLEDSSENHLERNNDNQVHSATMVYSSETDRQDLINKLEAEFEALKKDYEMAKGTTLSQQRVISYQECQLRKALDEKEILQREAKEKNIQLQAMSMKFSSLREDRKHEEIMAAMEKENYNLKELVTELKTELTKRNDLITSLKQEILRLQKGSTEYQIQLQKSEREKDEFKRKAEDLLSSNQQIKVSLECLQSRFDRFRSKMIQATYSAPGIKCPQVEITDGEILEGMQRIIAERSDYHQQLKQKGVKVPSLYINENTAPKQTTHNTKRKV
ncbi:hypothetical protein GDO86_012583, partial [Hymenochirus boettgeri]